MKATVFTFAIILLANFSAHAEPAYCELNHIKTLEIKKPAVSLERLHAFQLGSVVLAGLAVGNSEAQDVTRLATHYSNASSQDKYCTWYFNDGNTEAEKTFSWENLPRPTTSKAVPEWTSKVLPLFHDAKINFVSCAERQKYLALGCNGQKHRGPTVFGMLLAYSGCTPKKAVAIANAFWGNNGIPTSVREQLAQKAFDLGQQHPEQSKKLQAMLTE